jgi:hypothetical protein
MYSIFIFDNNYHLPMARGRVVRRRRKVRIKKHKTKRGGQRGGILPFLPLMIPALIAAGKAAALGAAGGATGYGVKKLIEKISK